VKLTSDLQERNFTCEGDQITITCEVFGSISLEWESTLFQQSIVYSAVIDSPGRIVNRDLSEANLTSLSRDGIFSNSNITSTLTITVNTTEDVSVQCFSTQDNDTMTFTLSGIWCNAILFL